MPLDQLKDDQSALHPISDDSQMFPEEIPAYNPLPKKYAVSQGTLIGRIGLIAVLASLPIAAGAAIFKCKQPDGSSGFQDVPCTTKSIEQPAPVSVSKAENSVVNIESADDSINPTKEIKAIEQAANQDEKMAATGDTTPEPSAASQLKANHTAPIKNSAVMSPVAQSGARQDMTQILITMAVWTIFAALLGCWASSRRRSFQRWFMLGMIFNPLLIALIFLFRSKDPEQLA